MFFSTKSIMKCFFIVGVLLGALACVCQAEAISPRRLVEVADISNPVVSPDGASVAFRVEQASIERNTYDSAWYVQSVDGTSLARRIADGGIPLRDTAGLSLPASAVWSPDGHWIYYRALLDGRIDIWRAATDGSKVEPVTLDPADVRNFALSVDGNILIYSVGASRDEVIEAEQAEYERGIRIEKGVPVGQNLFRSGNIEGRWATQRYSSMGADREALLASVPDRWKVVDLIGGAKRDATPSEIPAKPLTAADLSKWLPEPWKLAMNPVDGRIALLTRTGDGDGLIYKPDVELSALPGANVRNPTKCKVEACTNKRITGIEWRRGTDEVLFTVTASEEGLAQSVARWNVKTGEVRPVIRSMGLINGGRNPYSACGLSSEALVCVVADANRPPHLERIDLETGAREVIFDPNPTLAHDIEETLDVQLLRWTDASGQVFTGQYFRARGTGETFPPLFVTYYSCSGFVRGGVGDEWPLASFAENGISALCINYAPLRLDAVERYDQGLSAVESAVALLASTGEIDRSKVGIGGLSFGSEVAYWVAMRSGIAAAVSVSSVPASPIYYLLNTLEGEDFTRGYKEIWGLGGLDETPERWRVISPTFNLDKFRAPILFQMSEQEYLFALDSMLPLVRDRRGDLYVFPNEPHQKFQPQHKLAVYERNLDWFRYWLQGVEDNDPSKAEQYTHWRAMREHQCEQKAVDDVLAWYCRPG